MLTLASHTNDRIASSPFVVQSAHFDVGVASAGRACVASGSPPDLLIDGLTSREKRAVLLNCQDEDGRRDAIFYTAMKLLCFDDQLFNLQGGCDIVRKSVSAARRAGRMTALLCTDARTAFTKRDEIVGSFGGGFDIVLGEPAAVLSLFGVSRIDTLVPKLARSGTGLILHRVDFPPIYLRPQSADVDVGATPISAQTFWSDFVPVAFGDLVAPARRAT